MTPEETLRQAREVEMERREIQILEALEEAGRPLTAKEIQERTGIPSPSLYRALDSLMRLHKVKEEEGPSTNRRGRPAKLYKLTDFLSQPEPPLIKNITAPDQGKHAPKEIFYQSSEPYSFEGWEKISGPSEVGL